MTFGIVLLMLAVPSAAQNEPEEIAWLEAAKLSGFRSAQAGQFACDDPEMKASWRQVDDRRVALLEPFADWLRQHPDKLLRAVPPILALPQVNCPDDRINFGSALKQYSISVDQLKVATESWWGRTK